VLVNEPDQTLPVRYGPWALVAGASAGLGAAFAVQAARCCFDVVLVARRESALAETASRIRAEYGVNTRTIVADLAAPDAGEVIAGEIDDLDLGVFVYNAAAEPEGRFLDVPLEEQRVNLSVNCWTPTVLAHRVGHKMVERGRGAMAIVSSMAALQGIKMFASYGAAKAYELILAEGLWDEFREHGVDVLSYVVGATASANFRGAAPEAYGEAAPSAGGPADRILNPSTPDEVAARLFERLHAGPRQYSHDADEATAVSAAQGSRADAVRAMGEITSRLARFQKIG
jgi:short-subunit dehydrogenase